MIIADIFPLNTFIREQTQTGRPKLVFRYVKQRMDELPETQKEKFKPFDPTTNEMPFSYLKRILSACKCKAHIRHLWKNIKSGNRGTQYMSPEEYWSRTHT